MNQSSLESPPDLDEVPDLLDVDDSPIAGPSTQVDQFERPKVPITLLTGYLGAGKSTLLEYILTADHGYRIAVCMNDFGDTTDIEAKALTLSDPTTSSQTSEFLSLPNGCLCCSVKDLGIAAIEEMVAAQKGGVDWVLVELTGVADPAPIAKSFWANEEMGDLILDGIICVVDSRNIMKQLDEKRTDGEINEAEKQIASSDVILLNKTDLVATSQLETVESAVRSLNPTLRIHKTVKSQMDLKELFNLHAYTSAPPSFESTPNHHEECQEDHDHSSHDHGGGTGVHNSGITTTSVPLPLLSVKQYDRLTTFLEELLWYSRLPPGISPLEVTPEILRSKGFIAVDDGRRIILQGVTDLFELTELSRSKDKTGEEGDGSGKVVFIGRGLSEGIRHTLLNYLDGE